jgi:hypothetical protein
VPLLQVAANRSPHRRRDQPTRRVPRPPGRGGRKSPVLGAWLTGLSLNTGAGRGLARLRGVTSVGVAQAATSPPQWPPPLGCEAPRGCAPTSAAGRSTRGPAGSIEAVVPWSTSTCSTLRPGSGEVSPCPLTLRVITHRVPPQVQGVAFVTYLSDPYDRAPSPPQTPRPRADAHRRPRSRVGPQVRHHPLLPARRALSSPGRAGRPPPGPWRRPPPPPRSHQGAAGPPLDRRDPRRLATAAASRACSPTRARASSQYAHDEPCRAQRRRTRLRDRASACRSPA